MSWCSKHSEMDESKSEELAHSDSGSVSVKTSSIMEEKHDRFYFPDGNVIFLVGFTLYRVHRFFFNRDSEIFRGMFDLKPPTAGQGEEESSSRNPIELKGQDKNDFECFLALLYPENYLEQHSPSYWFSCLRFSIKWGFEPQKRLAANSLEKQYSPADAIAAGRLCNQPAKYFEPHFKKLIETAPTPEQLRTLDSDDILLLCRMQGSVLRHSSSKVQPNTRSSAVREFLGLGS